MSIRVPRHRSPGPAAGRPGVPRSAAARLHEAEQLFRDFQRLTPYPYPKAFTKSFATWDEYEQWRRAQTNPWLR